MYRKSQYSTFLILSPIDDITDSYRRLRRLVMDYLGMNVPSPDMSDAMDQSHTGSQFFEKEATNDTIGSTGGGNAGGAGGMGARTWSKPSLADNGSQGVNNVLGMAMSPMPPAGRGVVVSITLYTCLQMGLATYVNYSFYNHHINLNLEEHENFILQPSY